MIVARWAGCFFIFLPTKQIKYQRQIVESLTMLLLMPDFFIVLILCVLFATEFRLHGRKTLSYFLYVILVI